MARFLRQLAGDIRYGFRLYLVTPFATVFVVLVLATAMSFVGGFLSLWSELGLSSHRGLQNPGRLVTISQTGNPNNPNLSSLMIAEIDEQVATLGGVAGILSIPQSLDNGEEVEAVVTEAVTDGFFSDLNPRMELGRGLLAEDHRESSEPVVVLSHSFWRRHFGGQPGAIGQTLKIRGPVWLMPGPEGPVNAADSIQEYRIVGVAGRRMSGTFRSDTELWMPYEQVANAWWGGARGAHKADPQLLAVARLASGAARSALDAELNARFSDRGEEAGLFAGSRLQVVGGVIEDATIQRDTERQVLLFLLSSVLLAFVAACNVSLFLFSRGPSRQRELGIRMAVGGSTKRLARQLVTEAGLLVVIATGLAILISIWLVAVLADLTPFRQATLGGVSPFDWRVLFMMAGAALILTVLVALAPMVGLRSVGIAASSRAGMARPGWVQWFASTIQIAFAGMLAGAALAFVWYLTSMVNGDHGFEADSLHVVVPIPQPPLGPPALEDLLAERERRRAVIEGLPGVEDVAFGTSVPGWQLPLSRVQVPRSDDSAENVPVWLEAMDAEYPSLLGMRLVAGRWLGAADANGVLVNETLARRLWNRTDVIGEILQVPQPHNAAWEVVGVLKDVMYGHPASETEPMAYRLVLPTSFMERIVVRSSVGSADIRAMLEARAEQGELAIGIGDVMLIDDLWSAPLAPDRARTSITVVTAVLVVLFAAFGFYGTQRYLVAAGRREYAVRSAVGAGPRALGNLVFLRGFRLSLPGLVLGSALAFAAVAWLQAEYLPLGVSALIVAAAVAAGIAFLTVVASVGPSRHARNAEPALVLREE